MKRIRPGTVLLLALILVLGYSLVIRQRREARLRAALALYKSRATGEIANLMGLSIPFDWPEGTTLAEAIERIKKEPQFSRFSRGLPILIDPDGLREAGQSLSSPLAALPPPDDPDSPPSLGEKLRIVLDPLGLAWELKDGAIVITSRRSADDRPAAKEE